MNNDALVTLKALRVELLADGFEILGYFGSHARGESTAESDLDLLYCLHAAFHSRYPGWEAYGRINEIRAYLSECLHAKVDLANRDALNRVGKKYILPETIYAREESDD